MKIIFVLLLLLIQLKSFEIDIDELYKEANGPSNVEDSNQSADLVGKDTKQNTFLETKETKKTNIDDKELNFSTSLISRIVLERHISNEKSAHPYEIRIRLS